MAMSPTYNHQHKHGSTSTSIPLAATSPVSVGIVSSSGGGARPPPTTSKRTDKNPETGKPPSSDGNDGNSQGVIGGQEQQPGTGASGPDSSINPNMPKGMRFNEKTMLLSSDEEFQ